MSTENIITIIVAVLSSGLISTLLQRHWAKVDEKKAAERACSEEAKKERERQELNTRMLKKVFRGTVTAEINQLREQLTNQTVSDDRLELTLIDLKSDIEDYFAMGGNGATHAAYLDLYEKIREVKPSLQTVAWSDFMKEDFKDK